MASSSSSTPSINIQEKYDVFLSFRGEDTRHNFISHLYAALCNRQIQTFFDQEGLKGGDFISPALSKAIEESKISVIIFSQNYASSPWCLEELVTILECKERNKRTVVPVFYHVSPSDVRHQRESVGDAFVEHEKCLDRIPKEKVQRWKAALTEASNLSGWDSTTIKPESNLVKRIVDYILEILMNNRSPSSNCKFLVGVEEHVEKIKSLFSKHQGVVIWGMGGIGKTTIAEVVYQQISLQFEDCSFIQNVREEIEKQGLVRFKERLLSKILKEEKLTIETPNIIPLLIQERVKHKNFLLVLDDVYDKEQLENLIIGLEFGLASKVIVTTRNKEGFHASEENGIYEVKELDYGHAFKLFCHYAFEQNTQVEYFQELSSKIVDHVKGHPLALQVLGRSLCGKDKEEWESALCSLLKGNSNCKIYNVLRISYDGLDVKEKDIFLDIACFFKGWDHDHVIKILSSCYNGLRFGLRVLIEKSLVAITHKKIQMHDLLQEMGWNIVREESPKVPGKRSRLFNEDAFQLLKNNTGTDAVQGLFLDLSKTIDADLSPDAFQRMPNLKFLNFYIPPFENCVHISSVEHFNNKLEKLTYLPNELRYLHWYKCPLKALPKTFSLENLVELALPYSKVKKLWKGRKNPSKLMSIDLHGSEWLTEIPDLSDAVDLERINLQNCISLASFHSSSQHNSMLHFVGLKKFLRVKSLPPPICKFKSLASLNLSGCSNLKISEDLCYISSLKVLDLSRTTIDCLPLNFKQLLRLRKLYLKDCHTLQSLPELPPALEVLLAINCYQLRSLPRLLGCREEVDASELKVVSGCNSPNPNRRINADFIFTNCWKLNENLKNKFLAEAKLIFQHMATRSVRCRHDEEFYETRAITLFLPGPEIPDWIDNRCLGDTLTIDLSPYWHNGAFIGFILCAAVVNHTNCDSYFIQLKCSFSNNCGSNHIFISLFDKLGTVILAEPDHLLLMYCPHFRDKIIGAEYHTVQIVFAVSGFCAGYSTMKCCGACPVYFDTNEAQPNSWIANFAKTHRDTEGSGSGKPDKEETEVAQSSISTDEVATTGQDLGETTIHTHTAGAFNEEGTEMEQFADFVFFGC